MRSQTLPCKLTRWYLHSLQIMQRIPPEIFRNEASIPIFGEATGHTTQAKSFFIGKVLNWDNLLIRLLDAWPLFLWGDSLSRYYDQIVFSQTDTTFRITLMPWRKPQKMWKTSEYLLPLSKLMWGRNHDVYFPTGSVSKNSAFCSRGIQAFLTYSR